MTVDLTLLSSLFYYYTLAFFFAVLFVVVVILLLLLFSIIRIMFALGTLCVSVCGSGDDEVINNGDDVISSLLMFGMKIRHHYHSW